ncbi:hypothetical protein [Ekhidna sp.]
MKDKSSPQAKLAAKAIRHRIEEGNLMKEVKDILNKESDEQKGEEGEKG